MYVSAPSLSTFPQELVLEICGYLETPQDRLNLVCCSRRFHKVFLPLLYRDLHSGGTLLRPIAQVVSTLAQKPALAACVQTLHLSPWETYMGFNSLFEEALALWKEDIRINGEDEEHEFSQDDSVHLKSFDFGPLHDHAKRVTRTDDEAAFWMSEIKMGNADAWVALLLTLVPNLRRLEAEFPYGSLWLHGVLGWAATGRFGSIPAFPSLAEVYVDWDSDDALICHKHLMPFFLVPSVRRFYARNLEGGPGSGFDQLSSDIERTGTSHITHIEIDGCDGRWRLFRLIESCEGLRSFKYNHRGCEDFNPRSLYGLLLPFQNTIETIWIDIQDARPGHLDHHHCDNPLPSFKEFTALKTLHLRVKNLPFMEPPSEGHSGTSLAQSLPSSIETLQVVDTGDLSDVQTFAQKLQDHVDHDLDQTPALAQIDFKPAGDSPERSKSLESMASACKKRKIEFHVCSTSEGKDMWGAAGFTPRLYEQ